MKGKKMMSYERALEKCDGCPRQIVDGTKDCTTFESIQHQQGRDGGCWCQDKPEGKADPLDR